MAAVHCVCIFSWWQSTSKLLYLILIIQDGDCTFKTFSAGGGVRASCYISAWETEERRSCWSGTIFSQSIHRLLQVGKSLLEYYYTYFLESSGLLIINGHSVKINNSYTVDGQSDISQQVSSFLQNDLFYALPALYTVLGLWNMYTL